MTLRISVLTPCPVAAEAAGVSVEDGGAGVAGAFCWDVCSLGGMGVLEQAARVRKSRRAGIIFEFFTEPRCSGRSDLGQRINGTWIWRCVVGTGKKAVVARFSR